MIPFQASIPKAKFCCTTELKFYFLYMQSKNEGQGKYTLLSKSILSNN